MLTWLDVPWKPHERLSAARITPPAGNYSSPWGATWDGYVIRGSAELRVDDGTTWDVAPGHAITWDVTAPAMLRVARPLELLMVTLSRHPAERSGVMAHPPSCSVAEPYELPHPLSGDPSSTVRLAARWA